MPSTYFAATDAICRDLNAIGKNTLEVDQDESSEDRLTFRILEREKA